MNTFLSTTLSGEVINIYFENHILPLSGHYVILLTSSGILILSHLSFNYSHGRVSFLFLVSGGSGCIKIKTDAAQGPPYSQEPPTLSCP